MSRQLHDAMYMELVPWWSGLAVRKFRLEAFRERRRPSIVAH